MGQDKKRTVTIVEYKTKTTDVDEHIDLINTLGDMVDQKEEAKKEKFIETMPTMIQTHLITCKDWAAVKDTAKSLKHIILKCDPPTPTMPMMATGATVLGLYSHIAHSVDKEEGEIPQLFRPVQDLIDSTQQNTLLSMEENVLLFADDADTHCDFSITDYILDSENANDIYTDIVPKYPAIHSQRKHTYRDTFGDAHTQRRTEESHTKRNGQTAVFMYYPQRTDWLQLTGCLSEMRKSKFIPSL